MLNFILNIPFSLLLSLDTFICFFAPYFIYLIVHFFNPWLLCGPCFLTDQSLFFLTLFEVTVHLVLYVCVCVCVCVCV